VLPVQLSSPKPPGTPIRNSGEEHWISPRVSREDGVVKITASTPPIFRVLIVDRDSMSGDLLANALTHGTSCQATTIRPPDLLRSLANNAIDLVVVSGEIHSDSGDGFDLATRVGRSYPDVSIVVLLHAPTNESVIKAFRTGARGVFSRQQPMTEFFDCVEHVRKGYIWAGKEETNSLIEAFKSIPTFNLASSRDSSTLTARELQVVHCAAKGKTNKVIASELRLSEHTVKNYLFRAFEKLGVSSRVELLFYLTLQGHPVGAEKDDSFNTEQNAG
jgi:two-component system, NarL family, nitrate/nitrite response regulator NarL